MPVLTKPKGMPLTDNDVKDMVQNVFDEIECVAPTGVVEHGGPTAAYYVMHDCADGFVCRNHYDYFVTVWVPYADRALKLYDFLTCGGCGRFFTSRDEFAKVIPL